MRKNNILIVLILIAAGIITFIISFFLKLFLKDKKEPEIGENTREERYIGRYEVKRE